MLRMLTCGLETGVKDPTPSRARLLLLSPQELLMRPELTYVSPDGLVCGVDGILSVLVADASCRMSA